MAFDRAKIASADHLVQQSNFLLNDPVHLKVYNDENIRNVIGSIKVTMDYTDSSSCFHGS